MTKGNIIIVTPRTPAQDMVKQSCNFFFNLMDFRYPDMPKDTQK